jgi:hypothetical protein
VLVERFRQGPADAAEGQLLDPDEPATRGRRVVVIRPAEELAVQTGYQIGLACNPAGAALRAQLGLPEDQGLVVETVVPDLPAAQAGIQPYDVLLKAADKPLRQAQDLIDVIQEAKDSELLIELIRGGKPMLLPVTPMKPSAETSVSEGVRALDDEARGALRRLLETLDSREEAVQRLLKSLEQVESAEPFEGPLQWRFLGPGTILPPDEQPGPPPEDMSITITRKGDKLAKMTVRQGQQQWEVTEEDLGVLPEKVRGYVEQILGRLMGSKSDRILRLDDLQMQPVPSVEISPGLELPMPAPEAPPAPVFPEAVQEDRLQIQLDAMTEQIEQLRNAIELLRESGPPADESPRDGP